MKISKGLEVRIAFELKVVGGDVIESAAEATPLVYEHGLGKMLPAIERVLEGLEAGAEKSGQIDARDAFGTEDSLPTMDMAKSAFPAGEALEVGKTFEAKGPNGAPVSFKIVTLDGDKAKVRLLHPLVGRDVSYTLKVLGVEDPALRKRPPALPAGVVQMDLEEVGE